MVKYCALSGLRMTAPQLWLSGVNEVRVILFIIRRKCLRSKLKYNISISKRHWVCPCVTWGENPSSLSNVALSNGHYENMLKKNSFSYDDFPRQLLESVRISETEYHVSVLLQIFKTRVERNKWQWNYKNRDNLPCWLIHSTTMAAEIIHRCQLESIYEVFCVLIYILNNLIHFI